MKARSITLVMAMAASMAGFSQLPASAEAPVAVEIDAHPTQFCCPEIGTWEMSGPITDSGSYVRTFAATSPPDRQFGVLGPFREILVFTGLLGTLTVREEVRDTEQGVTGVWQIASGTGAYEDASGHGTVAFFANPDADPKFTLALTGVISKAS